jgi:sulfite exporter TauE/SafE
VHGNAWGSVEPLAALQAAVALAGSAVALYCAFALLGRVSPPDRLLAAAARWWGRAMRATALRRASLFEAGLLWGLLPCGLAMTGLLAAAAAGRPLGGAAVMLAFGVGTLPAHVGIALAGHRLLRVATEWPRRVAALVTGAFGVQLVLRGLASLGAVGHFSLGHVALW